MGLLKVAGGCGVVVLLLGALGSRSTPSSSPAAPGAPNPIKNTEACAIAEKFVTDKVRAPATADFPWACNASQTGDKWVVKGYVDSQNGFGAKLRTNYVVTVHPKTWKVDRWSWALDDIQFVSR